mmetsp:Transcript_10183/g.39629  ORF Transcript_10183/g.39629 Transcript_10183/m.39629 type:complete len:343 (-) Transcript_10183:545-1573(-)
MDGWPVRDAECARTASSSRCAAAPSPSAAARSRQALGGSTTPASQFLVRSSVPGMPHAAWEKLALPAYAQSSTAPQPSAWAPAGAAAGIAPPGAAAGIAASGRSPAAARKCSRAAAASAGSCGSSIFACELRYWPHPGSLASRLRTWAFLAVSRPSRVRLRKHILCAPWRWRPTSALPGQATTRPGGSAATAAVAALRNAVGLDLPGRAASASLSLVEAGTPAAAARQRGRRAPTRAPSDDVTTSSRGGRSGPGGGTRSSMAAAPLAARSQAAWRALHLARRSQPLPSTSSSSGLPSGLSTSSARGTEQHRSALAEERSNPSSRACIERRALAPHEAARNIS